MSENIPPSSSIICKCCGAESYRTTMSLLEEPSFVSALKKQLEQLLPVLMVNNVRPVLEPMMQSLVHKVMERGLDSFVQRVNARAEWNEPRKLALKFSDTVPSLVYTGKDIKGKDGNSISIFVVDDGGETVNSGVEASSDLEIIVVADEHTQTLPLLSRKFFRLKDGVAVLDNLRFKSRAKWTKNCKVKLVARILTNSPGSTVEDAETDSFLVYDSRSTYNNKREIPLLSDNVWRLKEIRKGGEPHKHLSEAGIETVEQLLVSLNTDPQGLQQILKVSSGTFKVILDHAQKCEIPGDRYIYHCTSCEGYTAVVFDLVGCVLGLVSREDRRFVPADDLNEDAKVEARIMVKSAFAQRKPLVPYYDNEASTSNHDFPSHVVAPPADHSEFYFSEDELAGILRFIYDSPDDSFGERAENLRMIPQCYGTAKGRWKRAAMFMKSMSKWKRIAALHEDAHVQKRQRCG